MKSLILADIHANLPALEAVFEREGSWDELLVLDDVVALGRTPTRCFLSSGNRTLYASWATMTVRPWR
jgi:hypothetical protein